MTSQRMAGKVCIVTGSSSGVGRSIATRYADEGASVVCADLRPNAREEISLEQATNTDELIIQKGGKSIFVETDVTKAVDVENLVKAAVKEYGRLDVYAVSKHSTEIMYLPTPIN